MSEQENCLSICRAIRMKFTPSIGVRMDKELEAVGRIRRCEYGGTDGAVYQRALVSLEPGDGGFLPSIFQSSY